MRLNCIDANSGKLLVSIHASVKDATVDKYFMRQNHIGFNPRICKRCDQGPCHRYTCHQVSIHASVKDATKYADMPYAEFLFQSTHL